MLVDAVEVDDPHDVGVPEGGDRPRLLLEPAEQVGIGGHVGVQHLDGHGLFQARVRGLVHGGHAAPAHERRDLVAAQLATDQILCHRSLPRLSFAGRRRTLATDARAALATLGPIVLPSILSQQRRKTSARRRWAYPRPASRSERVLAFLQDEDQAQQDQDQDDATSPSRKRR